MEVGCPARIATPRLVMLLLLFAWLVVFVMARDSKSSAAHDWQRAGATPASNNSRQAFLCRSHPHDSARLEKCNENGSLAVPIYCYITEVTKTEFQDCLQRREPLYCAVANMAFFHFLRIKTSIASESTLPVVFPTCNMPLQLIHGRGLLRSCALTQPQSVRLDVAAQCGDFVGLVMKAFARVLLMWLSKSTKRVRAPNRVFRPSCWEPDLQAAEALYDAPGKWDVDDRCIDTVQDITGRAMADWASRLQRALRNATQTTHEQFFLEKILQLVLSSHLMPMTSVKSAFAGFRTEANKRRHVGATSASVTCAGMRGTPQEVYVTVLTLLRLLLVNVQRQRSYWAKEAASASILNSFLPCSLSAVVHG